MPEENGRRASTTTQDRVGKRLTGARMREGAALEGRPFAVTSLPWRPGPGDPYPARAAGKRLKASDQQSAPATIFPGSAAAWSVFTQNVSELPACVAVAS